MLNVSRTSFRHFLGGRNEQHIVADNAADKRFKHGVMRAAKHERVDFATTQRFKDSRGRFPGTPGECKPCSQGS